MRIAVDVPSEYAGLAAREAEAQRCPVDDRAPVRLVLRGTTDDARRALLDGADTARVALYVVEPDGCSLLGTRVLTIGFEDDAFTLRFALLAAAEAIFHDGLRALRTGRATREPAELPPAGAAPADDDARLDWRSAAALLHAKVRAFTHPHAGASGVLEGGAIRVFRAHPADGTQGVPPGTVVAREAGTVLVQVGDGVLRLEEWG